MRLKLDLFYARCTLKFLDRVEEGMIMTKSLFRSVIRPNALIAIGFASLLAVSQAKSAEPSSAMLGVVPVDRAGQTIVQDVYVGAPAHAAGLRPGDRILEIDGKPVNNAQELMGVISGYEPNKRIEIRASRDGWVKQLSVTLAKRDDVIRRPLSSVTETRQQQPGSTVRPRGYVDAERARHINDPYYRAKRTRW